MMHFFRCITYLITFPPSFSLAWFSFLYMALDSFLGEECLMTTVPDGV